MMDGIFNMKEYFDFKLEPGKKLEILKYETKAPEISIIIPFYNDGEYIEQTVISVLNQTYPYFELLIIDDGSKDEKSIKKLEQLEKLDYRIKIFHKENEGLAATRDYGAAKASYETKYFMFLDSDDLIEKTFLECSYWTLETNKDASWAYSDSVGFDNYTYTWNMWFDSEKMKKVNDLIAMALIRKEAYYEVNGYELKEKAVNEDWNFWLKLIAKGRYPVHMSFYGEWYRRKEKGELAKSRKNKERSLEIINNTAKLIEKRVEAIQYPKQDYNYDNILEKQDTIVIPEKRKDNKINILMIIPWMITGGADKFNLELVKRLDRNKFNITIITTESNINVLRQQFEKYATVYDLTTFLNQKDWLSFINYIIQKENINLIFNTNSKYGYSILPYLKAKNPAIPILDYVHMEEWYYRNGGYARDTATYESIIDKTLVCNRHTENVLKEYFNKNEDEVQTVYIGVDEEKFNPKKFDREQILEKYNLKDNKKIIISYICRITEQKRPFLLLEIIKKLKEKRNDILFLIVGEGNLLPKFKDEVQKYNLNNYVKILGNIESVEEIYAITDLTINCSIKEGLALTSYESLAMGVPVISSDVGGQAELITENVGRIVPCIQKEIDIYDFNYDKTEIKLYVDAIEEIIKNIENIKNNCRERILEQFTLTKMSEEMTQIFKNVVERPNDTKIQNGKAISKSINLMKELICINLMNDKEKNKYAVELYEKNVYGRIYSKNNYNYKKELLKERLWKYPIWRIFIKTTKKILRKN